MEPAWLDGNAVAGLLAEALGEDMTVVERECGDCGTVAAIGPTAPTAARGVVLRCPGCGSPGLRVVELAEGFSVSWARPGADPAP
jgi:hypothetical protein